MIKHAQKATFIPLYEDTDTPIEAANKSTKKLAPINQYDVVILGLGTDGHTASLFPKAKNLQDALAADAPACLAIDPITNNMMRVTQSKVRLLNASNIYFHLVGKNKLDILNKVLTDSNVENYPASHFIHQNAVPITIYFAQTK